MDYDLELDRVAEEIAKLRVIRNTLNVERRTKHETQAEQSSAARSRTKSSACEQIKVCLQLPDGFKGNATEIVRELERLTNNEKRKTEFYLWAGSNFGGCDVPVQLEKLGFDLVVGFGHCAFKK